MSTKDQADVIGETGKGNLYDPYAIGLYTKIRGKITSMSLVGHLLAKRNFEILYIQYIEYGGNMTAIVRDSNFWRSPLPQGQGGQVIPLHKSSVK